MLTDDAPFRWIEVKSDSLQTANYKCDIKCIPQWASYACYKLIERKKYSESLSRGTNQQCYDSHAAMVSYDAENRIFQSASPANPVPGDVAKATSLQQKALDKTQPPIMVYDGYNWCALEVEEWQISNAARNYIQVANSSSGQPKTSRPTISETYYLEEGKSIYV